MEMEIEKEKEYEKDVKSKAKRSFFSRTIDLEWKDWRWPEIKKAARKKPTFLRQERQEILEREDRQDRQKRQDGPDRQGRRDRQDGQDGQDRRRYFNIQKWTWSNLWAENLAWYARIKTLN